MLFTVYGDVGVQDRHVRVFAVKESGMVPGSAVVPDDNRPLVLPGTIGVWLAEGKSAGLLLQLEDARGQVVGRGRTQGCLTAAAKASELRIELQPGFTSWDNLFTARCNCGHAAAATEMCPASSVVDVPNKPLDMPDAGGAPKTDAGTTTATDAGATPTIDAAATPDATDTNAPPVTDSDLFGFEATKDWMLVSGTLNLDTASFTQGKASIAFTAAAAQPNAITSRPFATTEARNVTNALQLDVFVPQAQDFSASMQIVLHCESVGIYEQYLTWHALQPLPQGKWSSLRFALTADAVAKLKNMGTGCVLRINHQGVGTFRFDNLAFVP